MTVLLYSWAHWVSSLLLKGLQNVTHTFLSGSCARPNNGAGVNCTSPSVHPKYGQSRLRLCGVLTLISLADTSVLPGNTPSLLSAPVAATPVFIAISITFTIIFFFLYTFIAFRHRMGKFGALFEKPTVQRSAAWIGLLGFMTGKRLVIRFQKCSRSDLHSTLGLTSFLILRMWFGKAVEDFNTTIIEGGSNSPQLLAETSNGFASECYSLV